MYEVDISLSISRPWITPIIWPPGVVVRSSSAMVHISSLVSAEDQAGVLPSETEGVRHGDVHVGPAGLVGDVVEVAVGIGGFVVDGGRQGAAGHAGHGGGRPPAPGGAKRMTDHRLGRTDGDLVRMRAQRLLDRGCLGLVVELGR